MKRAWISAGAISGALLLAGCGQKGPLYMPDEATQVVTRPTQTPPAQDETDKDKDKNEPGARSPPKE